MSTAYPVRRVNTARSTPPPSQRRRNSNENAPTLSNKKIANWRDALMLMLPIGAVIGLLAIVGQSISPVLAFAGVLYLIFYLWLTYAKPQYALLLTFALTPFVQDLSIGGPFRFSIGELNLVLAIPAMVLTCFHRVRYPAILWLNGLYLLACATSSVFNVDHDAATPMLQMCIYLVFAIMVFSSMVKDPARYGMVIDGGLGLLAILAMLALATNFSFMSMHKNAWGACMSGGFIIAVELWLGATGKRRRIWIAVSAVAIAVCLLMSLSRGGWAAAFIGCGILLILRRQVGRFLKIAILLIPVIAVMWFMLPEDKREYATGVSEKRWNIKARYETIDIAYSNFKQHPLLGVGIGFRKEIDATNIIMISLAESGIIGLSCFLLLHCGIVVMVWRLQKKIVRTSVLYSPVALAFALPFARLTHGLVDHYWSRGPLLQAWAAVGMAVGVQAYLAQQGNKKA